MSPELIGDVVHLLDNDGKNRSKYADFKDDPRKEVLTVAYPGGTLYQSGRKVFILDDNKGMVTYYMKWETRRLAGRTAAYQVIVWRHEDTSEARGIAQDVFWDVLFADHDIVCSDRQQSSLGRRFWKYQLDVAFKEGYPVYLLDLIKNTKTRMNNSIEVNAVSDKIWASRQIGQAWLLCITKRPFWG